MHLEDLEENFVVTSILPLSSHLLLQSSPLWNTVPCGNNLWLFCLILFIIVKSNRSERYGDAFLRETEELCKICWIGIPYKCILRHCMLYILILRGQGNDIIIIPAFDSLVSGRKIYVTCYQIYSSLKVTER